MIKPAAAMVVLGFGTVVSHGFGLSLVPAMLPRIDADFGVGYGVLGTVVSIGLVCYSGGALSAGRIADRVRPVRLLVTTYLVTAAGLVIAGAATSPIALVPAVAVLGFSAPVSWAATLHIAGEVVAPSSRSAVMSGAASGAALGVLINGGLVLTSADLHTWRVSFVIAAALAAVPVLGSIALFRSPVPGPSPDGAMAPKAAFREVLSGRSGRVAVVSPLVAGLAGFPFAVFLTATAIDEIGAGSWSAGALWWIIGGLGTLAGPVFGRFGDARTPSVALAAGAATYAVGLLVLVTTWNYAGLVAAAIGYAAMNYPIWGLVGAVANRHFRPSVAVRAIALGLIGASAAGAAANAASGAWIEATGSFRVPVAFAAAIMAVMSAWHLSVIRRDGTATRSRVRAGTVTQPTAADG